MEPKDEELLLDLLMRWEELRDRGQEVSVADLCRTRPDLKDELAKRINALEATSWLEKPLEDDDPPDCDEPTPSPSGPKVFSGRYRLDALVAEGGFAQVWKGMDLELKRIVAIKIPKPSRLDSAESFFAEAQRVARLKHPGIVPVYDVGRENDTCFIVSEYVEGGSLKNILASHPLKVPQAIKWLSEIADALDYAHNQGIVHRDIKPANILIDHHGRALLADFGIAHSPLKASKSIGTLKYMSPEQLAGEPVDGRGDIYSLGVVLHECLTGELPYPNRSQLVPGRIEKGLPKAVARKVPKAIRKLCERSLSRDPALRPTTAGIFSSSLRRAYQQGFIKKALPTAVMLLAAFSLIGTLLFSRNLANAFRSSADKPLAVSRGSSLTNSIDMGFRLCPAGSFMMGDAEGKPDETPHPVTLSKPFYIGTYEITNAQWRRVMETVPSRWHADDHPVENVTWDHVVDFCHRLSSLPEEQAAGRTYRLPTEAEWEYACRAGATTRYCFGDTDKLLGEYAWFVANSAEQSHAVGGKKPNAWGLYDVHGNVWEYCGDWFNPHFYANSPALDPRGPTEPGPFRVIRGGSWRSDQHDSRAADRHNFAWGYTDHIGARLVMELRPSPQQADADVPAK